MQLSFGPSYERFREEARAFIGAHWSPGGDARAFRAEAIARGYFYPRFPKAYGGGGGDGDPLLSMIVREECAAAGAPFELAGIGVKMLAPTLLVRGAEWQKQRFIGPTLMGDVLWCQGYSEPEAGSDLASLRTRAVREGDEWVIHGHKIWTSDAHRADFMFLLARTGGEGGKHNTLSYLLLDMRQPGVTVRPLKQLTGESHFNEVFLDGARTPADWIVGAPGEGWSVGRTTLAFERAGLNAPDMLDDLVVQIKAIARTKLRDGRPLIEHDHIMEELGIIDGYCLAHRYSVLRQVAMDAAGEDPGLAALCTKLSATDIGLRIARLAQDVLGDQGLLMPPPGVTRDNMDPMFWALRAVAVTIAGGASNIQRNIIAERGLDLPRSAQ
ncbi:MAG: acyl-CoA dehydrogenase family protein [Hyphomonadaceae bacterium]|nr:acyl-CoA dehydrogenase family protein [Hyphomonadaceae bacterium]